MAQGVWHLYRRAASFHCNPATPRNQKRRAVPAAPASAIALRQFVEPEVRRANVVSRELNQYVGFSGSESFSFGRRNRLTIALRFRRRVLEDDASVEAVIPWRDNLGHEPCEGVLRNWLQYFSRCGARVLAIFPDYKGRNRLAKNGFLIKEREL